jgi:polar amino acid transport system permease protein
MLSSNPIVNFFLQIVTLRGTITWDVVWQNLFSTFVLQGVILTITLAVLAQLIGVLIGLLLYFMRRARLGIIRGLAEAYVWFFRGTPLLVQVLFASTFFAVVGLSRQLKAADIFTPLGFRDVFLDAFIAALIALALNEGAYMAEIIRAGIDSIDVGQMEAAKSLGMTYWLGMRRIVLPQAMRVILPPLGNEFNSMLKNTAAASLAGLYELFGTAEHEGARTFNVLEYLIIASIWFLTLTTIWGFVQSAIERRFSASTREPTQDITNWWGRAFGWSRHKVPVGVPSEVPGEVAPSFQGERR